MSWYARVRPRRPSLRRVLTNIETDVAQVRRAVLEIPTITRMIKKLEMTMTDVSSLLNDVADGLRGPLATSINELIASEAAARARVAELEGEDVAESTAAANVKAAFDEVAGKLTAAPEAPDVDPLPAPDEPTSPAPVTDPTDPGPVPGDDSNQPA